MTEHPALAAERSRAAALVAGDRAALEALIEPDVRYVHSTGVRHDRAAYLAYLATGPRFERVEFAPDAVHDLGDAVVLAGRLFMRIQRAGEAPKDLRSFATALWRRRGERWSLAVFQSTTDSASAS